MEIKHLGDKGVALIKKYKYVIIVLLLGIALMLIPVGKSNKNTNTPTIPAQSKFSDPTDALQSILSQIDGAGKVKIMLTVEAGEKTVYQSDQTSDETSVKLDTVIITDGDRTQSGMIQQILAPIYRGAVVVCQGADKPNVKLAVMEAVKNMTGLGYDRISVLKMK